MSRGVNKVVPANFDAEAFWSKVGITSSIKDCWNWRGAKKPKGYGNIRVNKKYLTAHRVAFEVANGPIPEGLIVCHVCDNPACCNPNHLMLGTIKSNAADMVLKNRHTKHLTASRGSKNVNAKLTESQIIEIRSLHKLEGTRAIELAERFEVTSSTIRNILNNKTWRHVNV